MNNDFFIYFTPLLSNFTRLFYSLNTEAVTSTLDIVFLLHYGDLKTQLLGSFYTDLLVELFSLNFLLNYVLFNTSGDLFTNFFIFNKESVFLFIDFANNFSLLSFISVSSTYDSFLFTNSNSFLDFFVFNT